MCLVRDRSNESDLEIIQLQNFNILFCRIRVRIIRMKFVLYCTFVLSKVQNPELKPGNNVLLFPGFVLSKVQKDNNIFNNIFDVRRTRIVLFVLFALFGVCRLNEVATWLFGCCTLKDPTISYNTKNCGSCLFVFLEWLTNLSFTFDPFVAIAKLIIILVES